MRALFGYHIYVFVQEKLVADFKDVTVTEEEDFDALKDRLVNEVQF